jgi:hypothetical protein
MSRYHITVMRPATPAGRFYSQSFHELMETLAYAFVALGHEVSYKTNGFLPEATNIVLGPQFCDPKTEFPRGTILYNLEQIGGSPLHLISEELSKRYVIWDYSPANLAFWHQRGVKAEYVPIGYMPQLTRIRSAIHPDVDVLFFGSMNPRRQKVIDQLQRMPGLRMEVCKGYGTERDPMIARSKVILNLHYYESPQLFEIVRVSYLLANRKAVVSERSSDFPLNLIGGVRNASYQDLAEACRDLVTDIERRLELQERGFNLFSKIRETDILRAVLSCGKVSPMPSPEKSEAFEFGQQQGN